MAEFVMKDLLAKAGRSDVVVESAAMHEDAIGCDTHRGTRNKLDEMGIPHPRREAWARGVAPYCRKGVRIRLDYRHGSLQHVGP